MDKRKRSEAALGVNYSMLYSMHTLPAAKDGGTRGEFGDRSEKPKNMNVRVNIARSDRSLENTLKQTVVRRRGFFFFKIYIPR